MSFFFKKPKAPTPNAQNTQPLNHIKVTQSVIGNAIPIIRGLDRVPSFLLWSKDFKAIAHQHQSQAAGGGGGKGLGGGSNNAGATTTTNYTYQTAMLAGLCQGPIDGIVNVWDTKGRFTQVKATENFTVPGGGGTYTVVNHGRFGNDHGVGFATPYSQVVNDFGSPGALTLSGTFQTPLTPISSSPGTGQYSVNAGTGQYTFSAADAGQVASITYTYNLTSEQTQEKTIVPTTPFQVTVSDSTDYIGDLGVNYSPSGTALQLVSGTPTVGQYALLGGGVYQFAAADAGQGVVITYNVNNALGQDAPTSLSYTLFKGAASQTPWTYLTTNHPGEDIGYTQVAYIASDAFQLGSNAEMPNYTYEVLNTANGAASHGAGIVDCNPVDNITALLTDPVIGIQGFPAARLGNFINAEAFWAANSFFITTCITNQTTASSEIGSYLEAGMTSAFWSEGLLKLQPFGDTSAAGNGFIYIAPAPVADLNDDDFAENKGNDPVKVTRTPAQDAYNRVQVEWINRANSYNTEITAEQDDTAINAYGLRIESPVNWHFIKTLTAATFAANLRLKRSVYIRNGYTFKLKGSKWSHLEPMDLVTITVSQLGFSKLPIRITKVEDDGANGVTINAEDFPWGTAQPTLYPKDTNDPAYPTAGMADPGNTNLVVFETTDRHSQQDGNILNVAASPQNNVNWGGCNLWLSLNGTDYDWFANISSPARIATLATGLPQGTVDPDTNTLTVNLSQVNTLQSFTSDDFNQNVPLCAIINTTAPQQVTMPFNAVAIGTDGGTYTAGTGWVGSNIKLSATILGSTQQPDDIVFNIGAPGGNNVCQNTTINLPNAAFQTIQLLGAATGAQTGQTFTVTYQDLTTQTFTQSLSDWQTAQNFAGETVAVSMNYYNLNTGAQTWANTQLYTYKFAVNPAKALKTLTLPANTSVSIFAVTCVNQSLELVSYQNGTLTAPNQYQLTPLHRGLFGSLNIPHVVGETFVRLDSAVAQHKFDPSYYGKTIFLKATSINSLGGREQGIDAVTAYQFTFRGTGPGGVDSNLGISNNGKGSIPNTWTGVVAFTKTDTTITFTYDVTVNRATPPKPYQKSTKLESTRYTGTFPITGLVASTTYFFYPYIDDSVPGGVFKMAQIGGAVGSPACAYLAQVAQATYLQGRNDHVALSTAPLSATTAAVGGSGGGSGGGTQGSCPRGDMVVYRKTETGEEIVPCRVLVVGDYIKGPHGWTKVIMAAHKRRSLWVEISTDCGEAFVVTPRHWQPTHEGGKFVCHLCLEDVLLSDSGRTFITGIRPIKEDHLCIGLQVESNDHCYFIGTKVPRIITHNNNQISIT